MCLCCITLCICTVVNYFCTLYFCTLHLTDIEGTINIIWQVGVRALDNDWFAEIDYRY